MSSRIILAAGIILLATIIVAVLIYVFVIPLLFPSPETTVLGFLRALDDGKYGAARSYVCENFDLVSVPLTKFLADISYTPRDNDDTIAHGRVKAKTQFDAWGYSIREQIDLEMETKREDGKWCLTRNSAQEVVDQIFKPTVIVAGFFNALNENKRDEALAFLCESMALPLLPTDFLSNQYFAVEGQNGAQVMVRVKAQARGQIGPIGLDQIPREIMDRLPDWLQVLLKFKIALNLKKNLDFTATTRHERGRWCMTRESFWFDFVASGINPLQ